MKKVIIFFLFASITLSNAQSPKTKKGPIIENFGNVYQIDNPDLLLKKDTEYKVIFDISTESSKNGILNPLIVTVARYLNMHAQKGILLKNMKIAVILHGEAAKSALNNDAYQKYYKCNNPNTELLHELKKAQVELYVCAQSYLSNKFKLHEKNTDIKVALSALTALVDYQTNDYQIINFN